MVAMYFMMNKREDVYMGRGKCDGMKIELARPGVPFILQRKKRGMQPSVSNLNRLHLILILPDVLQLSEPGQI